LWFNLEGALLPPSSLDERIFLDRLSTAHLIDGCLIVLEVESSLEVMVVVHVIPFEDRFLYRHVKVTDEQI
jgi:hypothetical protein